MPYSLRSNYNEPLLRCPGEPDNYENTNGCHDKIFALIFCAQATAALAYGGWSAYHIRQNDEYDGDEFDPNHIIHRYGRLLFFIAAVSLLAGISSGLLWFRLMHHHVKLFIYTGFAIQGAILIYLCTIDNAFIIPVVLLAIFFWVVRRFIPLAAFLIDTGITVLFANKRMIGFSLLMVALQGILVLVWLALTAYAALKSRTWKVLVLFLISTYWVGTVASNIMHFTVCHVVGGWFLGDDRRNLRQGMHLATWWSFGSIALGSLIVTITHVLHMLVRGCRRRDRNGRGEECALCLLDCLSSYLERLAEWVNVYAIAYVALTGSSFFKAASTVWTLFQRKGFSIVINDDLVHIVLALGPIVVATVVAVTCTYLLDFYGRMKDEDDVKPVIIAISFVMTFWVNLVMGQVLHSIVITLYICYLDNTRDFSRCHPHICNNVTNELVKAYPSYRPPPEVNPEWARLEQQRDDDYVAVV